MTEEALTAAQLQERMLHGLPRYKDKDRLHLVLPRYERINKLLTNYEYNHFELNLLQQEIDNIEPYKNDDHKEKG